MLDTEYYKANYGVYMPKSDLPVIAHPVIHADGMHFYCLSTSAAADGTRAEDWYKLSFAGVTPVCSCPGFTHRRECPHIAIVAAQVDDLCKARTARWATEHAARRAAGQEGRAA